LKNKSGAKVMKKFISIILLICGAIAVLTGCGGKQDTKKAAAPAPAAKEEATYKVGMDATYAPFGFQDQRTKEYVGFDVDIIKAIAKNQGFNVKIQNLAFDGLIPALQTGNLDIVINDMTITEERSKAVIFSKPYYIAGQGLLVNKNNNNIKLKKDLSGKKVGVSIGSTGAEVAHKLKNVEIKEFNTIVDAFLELKNGGVDAVINDKPTNEYYVTTSGKSFAKAVDGDFEVEYLGIAVSKKNSALMGKIDKGLAAIKANGQYAQIYKKWFGKEPPKDKK
jgi:glutamine transport system substrate-binding protein